MKENRKTFDRIFKQNAIRLSNEKNSNVEIEKQFGLSSSALSKWKREYKKFGDASFPGKGRLKLTETEKKIQQLEKKIKKTDQKFDILKNAGSDLYEGSPKIFRYISSIESRYSVRLISNALAINRGAYSKWKNNFVSEREQRRILLRKEITSIFHAAKRRYGSPRITAELCSLGYRISQKTVRKYMRELDLTSQVKKN